MTGADVQPITVRDPGTRLERVHNVNLRRVRMGLIAATILTVLLWSVLITAVVLWWTR
jgi:hypothetical protein